jgi:CHAT domain-containing protein/Tfp pilus assembly protein PilF
MRKRSRPLCRLLYAAVVLLLWSAASGFAQPAPRTAAQRERLKDRDRLAAEVSTLRAAGKLAEAVAACAKKLAIEREVLGDAHDEVAESLDQLAGLHEEREDFPAARTARQEVLKIQIRLHGEQDWRAADARRALADLDRLAGMAPEQRRRLAEARRADEEAERFSEAGKYAQALTPARKAVEVKKQLLGEEHPDYANSLSNLARMYQDMGNYAQAEPLFQRAREIWKRALGEQHPDYATALHNLALLYQATGEFARAEPLVKQSLEITKGAQGDDDPEYATSLNNLAYLYWATGDYAKAEPLYRRALEIRKQALGEQHPDYAMTLNNLAGLYWSTADYARAEALFRRVLEIQKRSPEVGEQHPDYAQSLNNLGVLYRDMGEYARAEPLLQSALEIRRKALGDQHPAYALSFSNLALLYQSTQRYDRAEALFRRALKVYKQVVGEHHPDYARTLHNLAGLYRGMGDFARAEPLYRWAAEIWKETLGEEHPNYALSLHNLAGLYQDRGDYTRAEPLLQRALRIRRRNLELAASVQAERQQLTMAASLRGSLDSYLTLAAQAGAPASPAYAEVLAWKGMVSRRQQMLHLARDTTNPEITQLLEDLQQCTARLAGLALATPGPRQRDAWRQQLRELTDRKENLEGRLAGRSPAFRQGQELARLTPEQLQAALPAGTVLLDILEYAQRRPSAKGQPRGDTERRLAAFVVRRDQTVARVELGPAAAIALAVDRWRQALREPGSVQAEAAARLRHLVWEPLEPFVAGVGTVLVSPDGALARFPLAALPGRAPGRYLLEEVAVAVVPVPQLLSQLLAGGPSQAATSLLLVGDVAFGSAPPASGEEQFVHRSAAPSRGGAVFHFEELPASRAELVAVRDAFTRRFPMGSLQVLRRETATKAAVRREAARHRFIHLATHGFFAPPSLRSALGAPPPRPDRPARAATAVAGAATSAPLLAAAAVSAAGPVRDAGDDLFGPAGVAGWNPGLLSGLALAGANQPPEPSRDDGILTALELAELDLRGCDLAVLSACDTGLGESAGGEGLLGLQRAFQVAGTHTVVATLWEVEDKSAGALMQRFYDNLWRRGLPKLEALRQAQLHLLRERAVPEGLARGPGSTQPVDAVALAGARNAAARQPPRTPPYYWAAFVLSGDWR